MSVQPTPCRPSLQVSSKILELARKQRMNTDVRRNIFCTVMTAEDFLDAFEKAPEVSPVLASMASWSQGWGTSNKRPSCCLTAGRSRCGQLVLC